jgi:hypothetical protein
MYLLKARISQACDAAVLAGARSMSRAGDIASQRVIAISSAQKFFATNYPDGYWNSHLNSPVFVDVQQDDVSRKRTVLVSADVQAPLYFLRLINKNTARLVVTARADRRDVNVMMVLDRSGSIESASACDDVRNAALSFVNEFAEGRDKVGLLEFNGGYQLDASPSLTFKAALTSKINAMTCGGWTGSSQAIWLGYQELFKLDERGALNVVLFFTDGRPTALTSGFSTYDAFSYAVRKVSDSRYGDGSGSFPSYSTTYSMGASSCQDAGGRTYPNALWNPGPLKGYIAADAYNVDNFNWNVTHPASPPRPTLDATGPTYGLMRHDDTSGSNINNTAKYGASGGCRFNGSQSYIREDIAYLPNLDYYGNSTGNPGYKPFNVDVDAYKFATGPYAGKIRPDLPLALRNASYNALDDAAWRIRSDTNLSPLIYAIALGYPASPTGTIQAEPIDDTLMKRVANVDLSGPGTRVQPARPKGYYVYSPDPTQLKNAFLQVASEILRLAI